MPTASNHLQERGKCPRHVAVLLIIKADLAYSDDNGRKIMDTVWLDVPGVRDGDYIQLYTGADGDGLFLNYKTCKEVATQEDFDKF